MAPKTLAILFELTPEQAELLWSRVLSGQVCLSALVRGRLARGCTCLPDLGTGLYSIGCTCGWEAMLPVCKHTVGRCPACGERNL